MKLESVLKLDGQEWDLKLLNLKINGKNTQDIEMLIS